MQWSEPRPAGDDVAPLTCESCGRRPAARVTVRRHVGLLVLQRFVTVQAVACRTCGRRLVRNFTLRTLVEGWWGAISFFFNWFVLASNAFAWLRLGRLNEPMASGTDGSASMPASLPETWTGEEPNPRPERSRRSRLLRRGAIAAIVLAVGAGVAIASAGWDDAENEHGGPHGAPLRSVAVQRELTGSTFITDSGGTVKVQAADCSGPADVADVHFQCLLTFANGESDEVLVHVLPNDLYFRSSDAGGA